MGVLLILTNSCKKKDDNNQTPAGEVPVLTTAAISNITQTTASCGGNITSDGGLTITAGGVCWSTSTTPTITDSKTNDGSVTGSFTSAITGLSANTTYYVRAYATNSKGTGYGNVISFYNGIVFNPSLTYGTVTDIDGNVYKTIIIGTQTWMAENLRTTKYRNGDPITNVQSSWGTTVTEAYCDYYNTPSNSTTYGRLYNGYAVTDSRNIAPTGWHVATNTEWTTLTTYLGGVSVAGGKLKETGTTHWESPNTGATNESGFSSLPGGMRWGSGNFDFLGSYGVWWSSTEYNINSIYNKDMNYNTIAVGGVFEPKTKGYSVRCIKD